MRSQFYLLAKFLNNDDFVSGIILPFVLIIYFGLTDDFQTPFAPKPCSKSSFSTFSISHTGQGFLYKEQINEGMFVIHHRPLVTQFSNSNKCNWSWHETPIHFETYERSVVITTRRWTLFIHLCELFILWQLLCNVKICSRIKAEIKWPLLLHHTC